MFYIVDICFTSTIYLSCFDIFLIRNWKFPNRIYIKTTENHFIQNCCWAAVVIIKMLLFLRNWMFSSYRIDSSFNSLCILSGLDSKKQNYSLRCTTYDFFDEIVVVTFRSSSVTHNIHSLATTKLEQLNHQLFIFFILF